jgi:16S rRNA (adenine1518-N6/adenine1519-N6)-dimethyltransferase
MIHPVRPKKSLGQNFLVDGNVLRNIADALELRPEDTVLEIGPGTGQLTELLQPRVGTLVAVEIDRNLSAILRVKFFSAANFTLVEGDILKMEPMTLVEERPLRVVGNIPYYITSQIIFHFFDRRRNLIDMALLMQREVAERIVAEVGDPDYGILSVFSRTFAEAEILLQVPRTVFKPRPKVDSALVRWRFSDRNTRDLADEGLYRRLVRTAFGQRRKMLRKSLREKFDLDALTAFELTRRPEELGVTDWIAMANNLADVQPAGRE